MGARSSRQAVRGRGGLPAAGTAGDPIGTTSVPQLEGVRSAPWGVLDPLQGTGEPSDQPGFRFPGGGGLLTKLPPTAQFTWLLAGERFASVQRLRISMPKRSRGLPASFPMGDAMWIAPAPCGAARTRCSSSEAVRAVIKKSPDGAEASKQGEDDAEGANTESLVWIRRRPGCGHEVPLTSLSRKVVL